MLQKPSTYALIEEVLMFNCDPRPDERVKQRLQRHPLIALYPAVQFCGFVWYTGQWHCEIWRCNAHVQTISAESPEEIMRIAKETYGGE